MKMISSPADLPQICRAYRAPPSKLGLLLSLLALPLAGCASDDAAQKDTSATQAEDPHAAAAEHGSATEGDESGETEFVHHGGHHRFDEPEKWAKRFENPERDAWQKPDEVIAKLGLDRDALVADIGSATGYFDVRLAKVVTDGRVWGVDLEPSMVEYLNARAEEEGLKNLKSVVGTPSDPKIPEAVDVVIVVNTYHHISERTAYFSQVRGSLRPGGRVAIVDFKKGDLPLGPPNKMKLAPEQVIAELTAAGYALDVDDRTLLPHQYLLIFRLPN